MAAIINFIGLKEAGLDSMQLETFRGHAEKEAEKASHLFKGNYEIELELKTHGKGGERKKYSVRLRLEAGKKVESVKDFDWELERALHKAFANLNNRLKHKYRMDTARDKPYE